jgi:Zn-finger protein
MTDNSSSNNDQKIKFSLFKNQFDMTPDTQEVYWRELVELFAEHQVFDGDKTKKAHFNGCHFHTPDRRQANVEAMHLLVLDYDDGLSIDQAKALFSEYEHMGYTSYNHQVSKNGKQPVDKYRVIFPLVTPCQMNDWMEIRHNVANFAPMVDMASIRLHQPFAVPLVRTDGEKVQWHNKGKWLDVSDWERQQVTDASGNFTANPINRSDHILKADDVVQTKSGMIRVGDVTENVTGVYCPFHDDSSPGEFISKSDAGNIYLSCKHCGTIYMENEEEYEKQDFDIANWIANHTTAKPKPKKKGTKKVRLWEDILGIGEGAVEPYTRNKRGELIEKHCLTPRKRMLLYAFEGFGKSYLTILWAQKGHKVIFGCNSNMQAREQAGSFSKAGCRVQAILSREHRLETEYDIVVDRYLPSHPWDHGKVNENATIANIMESGMTEDEANQLWDELEAVGPDFENHEIVVTTHARIQSWGRILESYRKILRWGWSGPDRPVCKVQIPDNAIVVYDDPSKDDFMRLAGFENRFADAVIDKKKIQRTKIDSYEYFVKPNTLVKGFGFDTQYLVFTTTELVTSHLIKNNYDDVYEPKLMPDAKMIAGKIHLLKTQLVRKKMDGILPPIVERIRKEGHDIEYIADGQGNKYNLTNTKGQNVFIGQDTIIEISQPHEQDVIQTQHELGWKMEDRFSVRLAIALDQVHQAIGRNSGYRWSDLNDNDGPSCIVLCEPFLYKALLSSMRYSVTSTMDVDAYQTGFRKRERNSLLDCVIWFLQNYPTYICVGLKAPYRQFKDDARNCLNACSPTGKPARKKRLLDSLTYLRGRFSESYKTKVQQLIDTIAEY